MDKLDEDLIQILGSDAQRTSMELSKQLGVSGTTIRRRMKMLIQKNIIRIVALADPRKINMSLAVVLSLKVRHNCLGSVVDGLAVHPLVRWIATTTGRFDIIALMWVSSTDELSNFIEEDLANTKGVISSETFVCLRVKKGNSMPYTIIFDPNESS
ncbi:Lrp/AsnC family transcriptional regulator [Chloroflexota bacterium]